MCKVITDLSGFTHYQLSYGAVRVDFVKLITLLLMFPMHCKLYNVLSF